MDITHNPDNSLTVVEPDGLSYTVSPKNAHAFTVAMGAECFCNEHLSPIKEDQFLLRAINERMSVLIFQRDELIGNVLARDRNELLDEIDSELKDLRERYILTENLIGIARLSDSKESKP